MAFYTRYIDVNGSYRICNPSTLDVDTSIICNEDREEEDPTCNLIGSETLLYTTYDVPAEIMCGRLSVGGYTSSPFQSHWNYWGNWWWHSGNSGWYCGTYYYINWYNTIETFSNYAGGYYGSYGYRSIKCAEVPTERFNEFSRVAGCQERRCVSMSWYSGYYYGGYNDWGHVCSALNGERDKHDNCRSSGCDESCKLEASFIEKSYEVDYEIVRNAYYCLSDFDQPEIAPCGQISFELISVFHYQTECESDTTSCFGEDYCLINEEPPEGFTELARTSPTKSIRYARTTDCDSSCATCVPCDETDACQNITYGGYHYYSLIGTNCCTHQYGWLYYHTICPDYSIGPNVKFVNSGGSCIQVSYDYELKQGELDFGTNRTACFQHGQANIIDRRCVSPAPRWTSVPECEDINLGECEIQGPNYTREYPPTGGSTGGSSFHECIPPTPPVDPQPEIRAFQSKTQKYVELTKVTTETVSVTYSCNRPEEYYKYVQCHESIFNGNCGCPESFNETNSCDKTVFVGLTLEYVPEEVLSTVTAKAIGHFCKKTLAVEGCPQD